MINSVPKYRQGDRQAGRNRQPGRQSLAPGQPRSTPTPEPTAARLRRMLVEAAVFGGLAVASTWPLALRLAEAVPFGGDRAPTVAFFCLWELGWNLDRLPHLFAGYWDAPIFHPAPYTFALSEPMPLQGIAAALVTLVGGSLVTAYNVVLLASLVATGLVGSRLLRRLGRPWPVALAGGAMLMMLPPVQANLDVVPLVTLAGVLATLAAVERFGGEPGPRRGLAFGVALGVTYLLCGQYAMLVAVVLLLAGWTLCDRQMWSRRAAAGLAAGGLAFAILVAPVAAGQIAARQAHALSPPPVQQLENLSAGPERYVRVAWPQLVPLPGVHVPDHGHRAYFLGTLKLLLCLAAIRWSRDRRWTRFCLMFAGVAMVVGFGPRAHLGPVSLHALLSAVVPGFAQVRNLHRAGFFVDLALVLLAADGLYMLSERLRGMRWRAAWLRPALLTALACASVIEIWPRDQGFAAPPRTEDHRGWLDILTRIAPSGPAVYIPFPASLDFAEHVAITEQMLLARVHGRPLVNGYSGFFPARYYDVWRRCLAFPEASCLDGLETAGARVVLVSRRHLERERVLAGVGGGRLRWLGGDDRAGVDVYELTDRQ
jgi:hypothetical protein